MPSFRNTQIRNHLWEENAMKRKILSFVITLAMLFTIIPLGAASAYAATISFPSLSTSAYCEFVASKTIPVYRDSAFATRGTSSPALSYDAEIWSDDTCRILKITDAYVQLQYPTSSGLRTGYIKRGAIIGVSAPSDKVTAKGQATTNTKAANAYYGYTEKGDTVYKLGTSGNYTQIIYEAKSGSRAYKLAYVLTSDYNSKVDPTVATTGVSVSPTTKALSIGSTVQLTATVSPSNATDKSVTWNSSNTAVATVSSAGLVTAKAAGSATITVKTNNGGKTATCLITIPPVEPTGVTVSPTAKSLTVDATVQLTETVSPSNATDKSVTWSSSDTAVATVSITGLVTAKAAGNATITVKTNSGGKTATCAITVIPIPTDTPASPVSPTEVTVSPTAKSLAVGSTVQLTATVLPSNATDKSVKWSSSNTAVATVSSTGLVTAKSAGNATITVKTNTGEIPATCKITASVTPTKVTVEPTTISLNAGSAVQLTATVSPSNATDKSVTWSSSNTKVATVSSKGKVTAKVAGTATITVKTNAGAKTATCKITVLPIAFSQTDSRWKDTKYGYANSARTIQAYIGKANSAGGNSSGAGCGLLALTNAVYYMNGKFLNPSTLASFSVNNGLRINGVGTSHAFPEKAASKYGEDYGFKYVNSTSSTTTLTSHLKKGGVAWVGCSYNGYDHIIAIVNYNSATEKYLVLDSYPSTFKIVGSSGVGWITKTTLSNVTKGSNFKLLSEN